MKMKNIEIEARSFITASQYKNLEAKLNKIAKFLGGINEETVYCGEERMRIRRDDNHSWLILKSGKIHDDFRNEIKIQFKKSDFEKLKEIFKKLGFNIDVIWFRKRKIYDWQGVDLFLDDTKGYGKIIELEKIGNLKEKEKIHKELENKLKSLGIKITPKNIFDEKFEYYKKNWRKILKLKN